MATKGFGRFLFPQDCYEPRYPTCVRYKNVALINKQISLFPHSFPTSREIVFMVFVILKVFAATSIRKLLCSTFLTHSIDDLR